MMITGDNERTARAVAERVGIDPRNVRAGVLPADKSDAVERIQADGRKAMMVGDGVNDAPALAVAYVGTAIGSGTDVAIEAADVTLMRDDPLDVVKAIRISDATLRKIRQNLVWALGYNTSMIPLASLGLLQPVLAAAAMAFSSVSVLANSLLFRRYSPDRDYELLGGSAERRNRRHGGGRRLPWDRALDRLVQPPVLDTGRLLTRGFHERTADSR
jgi:Cu+-exporting ATPase